MLDLLVGVFVGFLSLVAVAFIARIEPVLLSYLLGCVALFAAAVIARRSWQHPRIKAISIGMIASAMFMLGVAIVFVLIALIAS